MSTFEDELKLLSEVTSGEEFRARVFHVGGLVHDDTQLKRFKKVVGDTQRRVFDLDPSFKEEFDRRRASTKTSIEAQNIAMRTHVEGEVGKALSKARRIEDERLEEWAEDHRFKVRTPDEAESAEPLVCPWGCPDHGNTMNGVSFCFEHRHKLVSKSEAGKYNREYKRNHLKALNRRRKKK